MSVPPVRFASDADMRARLLRSLRSFSGTKVMEALAQNPDEQVGTSRLARLAGLSSTPARTQAWRAARLGFATEEIVSSGRVWRITPAGVTWQQTGEDVLRVVQPDPQEQRDSPGAAGGHRYTGGQW